MTISSHTIPAGVYTPITTFFKSDSRYTLDLETQARHAQFLYNSGIKGLVVAGSIGEAGHMTRTERYALVAAIRAAVPDPAFKLIAGAPPLGCVQEAIEESHSAKEAGADFVILLVPGYFGPHLTSQEGIIEYFTQVADGSSLPVMIYNYPGTCNNITLTIESFRDLAKHPNISGVKLTHFNLDLYALLGKDKEICEANNFRPFTGLGQVLIPGLSVGLYGTIDGLSGIFPKTMLKLYSLFQEGKLKEAADLQFLVTKADQMLADLNLVGAKVALHKYYGFGDCLTGRPPLCRGVDEKAYAKYTADMDAIHAIEQLL
ncbi:dihydrodipicolinate synthase [Yamadazyma tenuis]|uniref:Aldolase n=1 Tax=Candida tenuis (strain ATCC 10573 / BCRC 21748 / CBS 615 / JCM 9827 / NBRC 10315 / NRRL Y-1498 / VKM Y-70) TaxID=590646 RepID=G3AWC7_CANTC|nr:aldolase [Yamadazyma tenuis ATCC 10573]EGV66510.1 aldolase [Yamadazyma tenuis ATCC 10573]WEJ95376.1 dihydrodipicolinate synthase [Yamadazyma tenuis]